MRTCFGGTKVGLTSHRAPIFQPIGRKKSLEWSSGLTYSNRKAVMDIMRLRGAQMRIQGAGKGIAELFPNGANS